MGYLKKRKPRINTKRLKEYIMGTLLYMFPINLKFGVDSLPKPPIWDDIDSGLFGKKRLGGQKASTNLQTEIRCSVRLCVLCVYLGPPMVSNFSP